MYKECGTLSVHCSKVTGCFDPNGAFLSSTKQNMPDKCDRRNRGWQVHTRHYRTALSFKQCELQYVPQNLI